MNYLYDTTLKGIRTMSEQDALRFINKNWFLDYYNIELKRENTKFNIELDGKTLTVKGQGKRSEFIRTFIKFIESCKLDNEILEILSDITIPTNFLINVSNSCALDSLLSIIMFARGGYFIARIQDSTPPELKTYPQWIDKDLAKRVALKVEKELITIYNEGKYTNVRELQRNLSNFIEDDCTDVKSVNEIWGVFCLLFDSLSIDILTLHQKKIGNKPTQYYSIPIGELDISELTKKPYHLVFLNDTLIEPMDFRTLGYTEEMDGYSLVGIINHTGAHYRSKILFQEEWYMYDDLDGRIVKYTGNILNQTRSEKIVMLFYTLM